MGTQNKKTIHNPCGRCKEGHFSCIFLTVTAAALLGMGCNSSNGAGTAPQGSGGQQGGGSGGIGQTSGGVLSGGSVSQGGSVSSGGIVLSGGTVSPGGAASRGGSVTTGGSLTTGGVTTRTAGALATGGMIARGGSTATGGSVISGGTTARGGSTAGGGATSGTIEVCLENSEPMRIVGQKGVVISGKRFTSKGSEPLIFVIESENVIIENCWFGPSAEEAVKFWRSKNVTVRNSYFEFVNTGVLAIETKTVVIDNNNFLNIQGDMNNVAFLNTCTGPGNRVTNNRGENIEGRSSLEDLVNLYGSTGLPDDPILVAKNHFRGGGPSQSGGGIMSGDSGGGYIVVRDNILVNPGNYGVAAAGGHHISLLNNLIYQESKPWAHFPAYIWDWESRFPSGDCYGHIIRGNKSTFYANNGLLKDLWYGSNDNCTWEDISDNNWDAGLTADILPKKLWTNEMPDPAAVACP